MDRIKRINELLNICLVNSVGFSIPDLLGELKDDNVKEIEDQIFAIIHYNPELWQELVELFYEYETIRKVDRKIQFGFMLKELLKIARVGNGR